MESETKAMTTKELTQAVSVLLEREKHHQNEERRRLRKQKRAEREERAETARRLVDSIEIIKWCIVGITSVMVIALIVLISVVMQVRSEAERIKERVLEIQREAEAIREKIRHPLESMGGMLGRQFDRSLGEALGIEGANSEKPKK